MLASLAITAISLSGGPLAPAQDVQSQLDSKQSQRAQAQSQKGVLTTTISRYSDQITQLQGEVATLRNREALVQDDLDRKQAELNRERHRLEVLRARLKRSVKVLDERLVAIYKSDTPDVLTVILDSHGFNDLLERYEYLQRIESQDSDLIARVRDLRNQTQDIVDRVRAARNEIRAKRDELARTRSSLEAKESSLTAVRGSKQQALAQVNDNIQTLEGDVSDLQGDIQSQLQSTAGAALPAGPIRGAGSGFIWPVNGSISSPFGMRWGRLHAGIDIAAPMGTPIRAAKAGSIAMAAPYGGYGNYTCIEHGGGLSSCYAHQSRFALTSGSVRQGQVIGYVGNTGNSFGAHLHFEIRVNGQPVDPMGYL